LPLPGRAPFPGGNLGEKIARHLMDEPIPVEQLRPDVPPGLAVVVRKLMAKKPEQRYRSPIAAAEALARGGEVIVAPSPAAASENTIPDWGEIVDSDATVAYQTIRPPPLQRPGRFLRLAAAAVVLVGLGLAGFLLTAARRPRAEPKTDRAEAGTRVETNQPPLLTNSIGMKLAFIPPGKFLMGSSEDEPNRDAHEGPRHEV